MLLLCSRWTSKRNVETSGAGWRPGRTSRRKRSGEDNGGLESDVLQEWGGSELMGSVGRSGATELRNCDQKEPICTSLSSAFYFCTED
jgi:hypothetical protein